MSTVQPLEDRLDQAADWVRAASRIAVLAGAGMGVDSGLPDFRGPEGFWRAYPPIAKLGLRFEEMANPVWFRRDPTLAWGFYGHRFNLYRQTDPHPGHRLLRQWKADSFVFTSNIDGHFERAGYPADRIVECHGTLYHWQCTASCSPEIWSAPDEAIVVDPETMRATEPLPSCPRCEALARPNVLMFGDFGWISRRTEGQMERLRRWLAQGHGLGNLVVIECGAGKAVPSVRLLAEQLVSGGARLVRINIRDPEVPAGQVGLPLAALDALRRLDDRLRGSGGTGGAPSSGVAR